MSNIATLNRKGRRPGATNLATRLRQAREAEAVKLLAGQIGQEVVDTMSPLDVLLSVMRLAYAAGNLAEARVAAAEAAPYLHSRKSAAPEGMTIPADLMPDPAPIPDEPGPEHPIY